MTPARLRTAERERLALSLRADGLAYSGIARAIGYADPMGAWKAIDRLARRLDHEQWEDYLEAEDWRLLDMLDAVTPAAMAGDPKAIDRYLAIMDKRIALYQAPSK